jgi:hypothetical protein
MAGFSAMLTAHADPSSTVRSSDDSSTVRSGAPDRPRPNTRDRGAARACFHLALMAAPLAARRDCATIAACFAAD